MRTKHTFRLPPDLALKLADYAIRKGVPQARSPRISRHQMKHRMRNGGVLV